MACQSTGSGRILPGCLGPCGKNRMNDVVLEEKQSVILVFWGPFVGKNFCFSMRVSYDVSVLWFQGLSCIPLALPFAIWCSLWPSDNVSRALGQRKKINWIKCILVKSDPATYNWSVFHHNECTFAWSWKIIRNRNFELDFSQLFIKISQSA